MLQHPCRDASTPCRENPFVILSLSTLSTVYKQTRRHAPRRPSASTSEGDSARTAGARDRPHAPPASTLAPAEHGIARTRRRRGLGAHASAAPAAKEHPPFVILSLSTVYKHREPLRPSSHSSPHVLTPSIAARSSAAGMVKHGGMVKRRAAWSSALALCPAPPLTP
jgi:hypothetical protein